jgi:hypothetical protein
MGSLVCAGVAEAAGVGVGVAVARNTWQQLGNRSCSSWSTKPTALKPMRAAQAFSGPAASAGSFAPGYHAATAAGERNQSMGAPVLKAQRASAYEWNPVDDDAALNESRSTRSYTPVQKP